MDRPRANGFGIEKGSCPDPRIVSEIAEHSFGRIGRSVIVVPFCFFEMHVEGVLSQTFEPRHATETYH